MSGEPNRWECQYPGRILRGMNTSKILMLISDSSQRREEYARYGIASKYNRQVDVWFRQDLMDELDERIPPRDGDY